MMRKENKKILLLLLIIILLFEGGQILAQQELEIEYPTIPGTEKPESVATPLPLYLKYIYNLSIFLAGILLFVLLVWGGVKHITSTNNPGKMADAKKQMIAAFLGIIVVFTSYLFLNTINPQLVELKIILPHLSPSSDPPPPTSSEWPASEVKELPVGTLITSEYTASSFFFAPHTDPDLSDEEYSNAFPDLLTYSESFQGALSGRRLKRIHEVASTTLPIADYIEVLYEEYMDVVDEMMKKVDELYQEAIASDCGNCNSGACAGNGTCDCSCICEGDTCDNRRKMEDLARIIPTYYDEEVEPNPILLCKMTELEYFSLAFEPFLDGSSYFVKNEDYQDDSFWYSDEAKELQTKIEDCISAGKIEQEQYDEMEDLIDFMADVEDKGTYTPKTDPPERDVGANVNHLESLLNAMKDIKRQINPFDQEKGYMGLMSFAEEVSWEIDQQIEPKIKSYYVNFPDAREEVDVKKDPATFYAEKPSSSSSNIKKIDQLQETDIVFKNNIAWAQTDEPAATTPGTCNHLVEIPIGRAFDEAIKLTQNIFGELNNVYDMGHRIIDKIEEVGKEGGLADQMFTAIDDLIEATYRIPDCDSGCYSECETDQYTTEDEDGNIEYHCECTCLCKESDVMKDIKAELQDKNSKARRAKNKIKNAYEQTEEAVDSIYESFYKLNSEYPEEDPRHPNGHPEAGERMPIKEDVCCNDRLGNCRADNWLIDDDKIEERSYTLKEKLVEIQKLLNRSREIISPQRGEKSVYILLIEDLIKLDYAEEKELRIPGADKMDLQNCIIIYENIEEQKGEEPYKNLLNCYLAKQLYAIDTMDTEVCSPDPYLDCDFFKFTETRIKSTMSCYCYNEQNQDYSFYNRNKFPEIYKGNFFLGSGNNYFCCITEYEK